MIPADLTSERSRSLTSMIEAEGVHYGREDSFKMSHAGLLTQRFLIGIPTKDIAPARILKWCDALGMPHCLQTAFLQHVPDANMVGVGLEDTRDHGVYKMYLEFWDKVRLDVNRTGRTDPQLLHLGLAAPRGTQRRFDRAIIVSRLSVHDTRARIEQTRSASQNAAAQESGPGHRPACCDDGPPTELFLVETSEVGNLAQVLRHQPLQVRTHDGDINPFGDLGRHYGLPDEQYLRLLSPSGPALGHLSGGLDRGGNDATTLYYETRPLQV